MLVVHQEICQRLSLVTVPGAANSIMLCLTCLSFVVEAVWIHLLCRHWLPEALSSAEEDLLQDKETMTLSLSVPSRKTAVHQRDAVLSVVLTHETNVTTPFARVIPWSTEMRSSKEFLCAATSVVQGQM